MAQNRHDDLLTLTVDVGHSKSIGSLGPIRSYVGSRLKFINIGEVMERTHIHTEGETMSSDLLSGGG